MQVPEVTDAETIFGTTRFYPKDAPEEFRAHWHWSDHPWCAPISDWFHHGAKWLEKEGRRGFQVKSGAFLVKPGLDPDKVFRALRAAMCTWEPKHEDKIAACGYLLSQWFDRQ